MDQKQRLIEQKRLIEDFGILFEESGLPRMAGRILGWLFICNPPYQSAAELCTVVGGSKGSISSMTRLLMHAGLVERMGIPGSRVNYYRIKPGSLSELVKSRIAILAAIPELTERGLAIMEEEDAEIRHRLEEIRDFYVYMGREMPALLDRWQQQKLKARLS